MSSIARRLAAKNTTEVRQETSEGPIFWRVRRLGPEEAVKANGLDGMIAAAIAKAGPESVGSMAMTTSQQVVQARGMITMLDGIARAAVTGVRTSDEDWETIRLVDPDKENGEAGLLSIATIDVVAMNAILQAAIGHILRAGDTVASFRPSPAEPPASD
jgi:hypothetical protein